MDILYWAPLAVNNLVRFLLYYHLLLILCVIEHPDEYLKYFWWKDFYRVADMSPNKREKFLQFILIKFLIKFMYENIQP